MAVAGVKRSFSSFATAIAGSTSAFLPVTDGQTLEQPQIPVTLPTWDEVAGEVADADYNRCFDDSMRADRDEVLTIHAEAEGMSKSTMFESFLDEVVASGRTVVPLGELMTDASNLPTHSIEPMTIPGREGWLATVASRMVANQSASGIMDAPAVRHTFPELIHLQSDVSVVVSLSEANTKPERPSSTPSLST